MKISKSVRNFATRYTLFDMLPLRKKLVPLSLLSIFCVLTSYAVYKLIEEDQNQKKEPAHIATYTPPKKDSVDSRIGEILSLIEGSYVDSINLQKLKKNSIQDLINSLDPHSDYLSPQEVKDLNLSLGGSFGGIGVEYYILNDTLLITNVTPNGPAEKAGLQAGDKIIRVDRYQVSGLRLDKNRMTGHIKGKNGSKITLTILNNENELKSINIQRKQISLSSINAVQMIGHDVGYIKITNFGENTSKDFLNALESLKNKGMKKLVMDLRDNGGGYLESAVEIADQFLHSNQLIVYTKGAHTPRSDYIASGDGEFKNGALAILVDENTASASEIVAGAIKDQNRGLLIGRRTFGKGLVQEQFEFKDGSALNLTVARYYTPSGKSIQKPYKPGQKDAYDDDIDNRLKSGELSTDSTETADTEGGITPNVFVKLNTEGLNPFYAKLVSSNLISNFTYGVMSKKYDKQKIRNIQQFEISDDDYLQFINYAKKNGVTPAKNNYVTASRNLIKDNISQLLARYYFGENGFYLHSINRDSSIKKALYLLKK